MFVCLEIFVPLENFSLIWRRHHDRWRAANFGLCPALVAIEQWGFFSVPHLLWHWISVYNGHLQEPVTLTPIAERLTVELSLPVNTTYTQPTAYGANALTHCATATAPATVVNDQISFGNWLEGDRLMALVMCGDGNSIVTSFVDHIWSRPV